MKARVRISKGGQISIPAPIRRKWGTSTVTLEEQGWRIIIAPAPDDPIDAAEGALADEFGTIDVSRLRHLARQDDAAATNRRGR